MGLEDDKNLFAEERRKRIVDTVSKESRVLVSDLSERFGVSQATLRNDLRNLEAANLLKRTHGGAVSLEVVAREKPADAAITVNRTAKELIGAEAAKFVSDGDVIFCDSGSTTLEMVRALPALEDITILTNDYKIALSAENRLKSPRIVLLGGTVRNGFHYALDSSTIDGASMLSATIAFVAASAFSFDRGFSVHTMDLANFKRVLIDRSEKRMLLLDSSKMGCYTTATFAQLDDFDAMVCDRGMSREDEQTIRETVPSLRLELVGQDKL